MGELLLNLLQVFKMLIIPHTACNKLLKQAFHKDRYKDRLRESKICNKIDVAFVRKCEFKMSEN